MAQNGKKFCLSHSISQEPYLIWLWFMGHLCKMMVSPAIFSFFQNSDFFYFLGGYIKGQKMTQSVALSISRTVDNGVK